MAMQYGAFIQKLCKAKIYYMKYFGPEIFVIYSTERKNMFNTNACTYTHRLGLRRCYSIRILKQSMKLGWK